MRKQETNYSKLRITNLFKTLILVTGFILVANFSANAQTYPKINQPWKFIDENHKEMLEVSVMVAQCSASGTDSVYVSIFNEKVINDTAEFDLTIYNENKSASTKKTISYKIANFEMTRPECGDNKWRSLVFAIPSGYDPKKVTFLVTYK